MVFYFQGEKKSNLQFTFVKLTVTKLLALDFLKVLSNARSRDFVAPNYLLASKRSTCGKSMLALNNYIGLDSTNHRYLEISLIIIGPPLVKLTMGLSIQ